MSVLEDEKEVSTTRLISSAHAHFCDTLKEETGWLLFNVKLDLEARGIIMQKNLPQKQRKNLAIITKAKKAKKGLQREKLSPRMSIIDTSRKVRRKYIELFHAHPLLVHSPRLGNEMTEHAELNKARAVDKGIHFAFGFSTDTTLIYSLTYKEFLSIHLGNIDRSKTYWQNYLIGVLHRLKEQGIEVRPFSCVFSGDLPVGAGHYSSGRTECGFVFGLNSLFGLGITSIEMLQIAEWSEQNYTGAMYGNG